MSSMVDSRIGPERILLVDDHVMFTEALAPMLAKARQGIAIDVAATCEKAVDAVERARYDLVLLDWHLPDSQGDASIRSLRRAGCRARIIVLSGDTRTDHIHEALQVGAAGFIPKAYSIDLLDAALNLVLRGGVFLPPEILGHSLVGRMPAAPPSPLAARLEGAGPTAGVGRELVSLEARFPSLTGRQLEVFRATTQGLTNKMIARTLGIAESTVKTHLSVVYAEIGVSNRTQAVVLASREGFHVG